DAQDFKHRVGIVGIPAASAEADLTEDFTMMIGASGESRRRCDEIIETAVVPDRHESVPDRLEGGNIARSDRFLDRRKARRLLERFAPGFRDLLKYLGQIRLLLGIVSLPFQIDDRRTGRRRARVGEGLRLEPKEIDIVVETGA